MFWYLLEYCKGKENNSGQVRLSINSKLFLLRYLVFVNRERVLTTMFFLTEDQSFLLYDVNVFRIYFSFMDFLMRLNRLLKTKVHSYCRFYIVCSKL